MLLAASVLKVRNSHSQLNPNMPTSSMHYIVTLGLPFSSVFFLGAGESDPESDSESDSESEELSEDELLAWPTGPLPLSSESLKKKTK